MKSRSILTAGLWVASLAVALWCGTLIRSFSSCMPPGEPTLGRPAGVDLPVGITASEVRTIVRDELSIVRVELAELHALSANLERESAEQARVEHKLAVAESVEQASAAIESGILDGVWDEADQHSLREHLAKLDADEVDAVLAPLFAAINEQRLTLEVSPF